MPSGIIIKYNKSGEAEWADILEGSSTELVLYYDIVQLDNNSYVIVAMYANFDSVTQEMTMKLNLLRYNICILAANPIVQSEFLLFWN